MTTNRFAVHNLFLGKGWNIFMVVLSSSILCATIIALLRAYQRPGLWPDIFWVFLALVFAHSLWTSAKRLVRLRPNRNSI